MHDPPSEEPLIDAALDREIERLLDVEPSPGFVARVRTRVSAEPLAGGAWWPFRAAGFAATVAATVAAALVWSGDLMREDPPEGTVTVVARDRALDAGSGPRVVAQGERQEADRAERRPVTSAAPLAPAPVRAAPGDGAPSSPFVFADVEPLKLPEVMLAWDEQRVLASLLAPQPPAPEPAPVPAPELAALPELANIDVAGVVVEPIAQVVRLEGELP